MAGTKKLEARLNVRLAPDIKRTIEEAAAQLGQTVSDFAVSTLVQAARQVIREQDVTRLSERDRKLFVALLDNETSQPNKTLVAAAKRYQKQVR
jgi:uncharacterized protein (DUF1778 family)